MSRMLECEFALTRLGLLYLLRLGLVLHLVGHLLIVGKGVLAQRQRLIRLAEHARFSFLMERLRVWRHHDCRGIRWLAGFICRCGAWHRGLLLLRCYNRGQL